MPFPNDALKKALAELELLPADRLEAAFHDAESRGTALSDYLVERNLITDENMGHVLADIPDLPYVNLRNLTIDEDALKLVPLEMARHSWFVPFRKTADAVHVAVNDLDDLEPIAALRKKLRGKRVQAHYATRVDIETAVARHRKDVKPALQALVDESVLVLKGLPELTGEAALKAMPIAAIVDTLLLYAYQSGASHLHLEPGEKETLVRFRVDGIMHDIARYPKSLHDLVVMRLKIMARLRPEERSAAQDGKFRTIFEGETVDVRIGVVPVFEGEKVVMRLLTERGRHLDLESIGLSAPQIDAVRRSVRKAAGMILAAGPAGSGKTATLYAILKAMDAAQLDITTIEDPIEYDLQGISQIQVSPKTGISFAAGFRAISNEPDVIMVGEINDEETAGVAVEAAKTDHFVLSSLYAEDAAAAVARLIELGVEPFQAAASTDLVIAQRLVRKICPHCVRSASLDLAEARERKLSGDLVRRLFGAGKKLTVFVGAKCQQCRFTGYQGRIGVFELLELTEPIRAIVIGRGGAKEIRDEAARQGMTTMLEDGVRKVLDGLTTLEELLRAMQDGS